MTDENLCSLCNDEPNETKRGKVHKRKMLVLKERIIAEFHKNFYKPVIQKLAFHLPHVRMLGTNNCGKMCREYFKARQDKKDVITRRDYAEQLTEKFPVQIQCQHFGGNRSLSMEGVAVQHFNIEVTSIYVS